MINSNLKENLGEELLSLHNDSNVLIEYQSGTLYPFEKDFLGDLYHSFFIYPPSVFGTTVGTNKGQKLLFSQNISVIKILRRPANESFKILVQNIAKKGQSCKFLWNLDIPQFFFLAKYAINADIHDNIRSLAISTLKRSCLSMFGVPLVPTMVIKLTFHPNIKKNQVKILVGYLLRFLPLPQILRKEILEKLRIVFIKNPTVKDILCNYKIFAKSFQQNPPSCFCNTTNDDHKILGPDDLPTEDKEIFLQNGNNTPRPKERNLSSEIVGALQPVIKYLKKINNTYPLPLIEDIDTQPSIMKKHNVSWYIVSYNSISYKLNEHRILLLYNLHNPLEPSLDIFATAVYNLCTRYKQSLDLDQWELRQRIVSVLNRLCGPFMEYWSTPLQVNSLSLGYFTQEKEDLCFNSNYNAFTSIWSLPGIIGPGIHENDLKKIIIWSLLSLSIYPKIFFLIIVDLSLKWVMDMQTSLYIQHWFMIKERNFGTFNIYIIGQTKWIEKDMCQEIMSNFNENDFELKWSHVNVVISIDNDIKELVRTNENFTAPWREIYFEMGLDYKIFNKENKDKIKIIKKEEFNFLPFNFKTVFPHKQAAETFFYLAQINILAFRKLENLLNSCLVNIKQTKDTPNFLLLENILTVKWKYRNWVITCCDKNSNLQLPICPVQYFNDMQRMFIKNTDMFTLITNTKVKSQDFEQKFLVNLKRLHNKNWKNLGKMKMGELPTAYTLPKFSDIEKNLQQCRVRPIITYAKFSMKKTLSIIAIGLNFLLSNLDTSMHYDINDTNFVKKNIEKINMNLPYKNFTGVITYQADIETMYDRIEPSMVGESLEWLFKEIKKIKRSDRIAVNFRERSARFGRNYGEAYELKFDEITNIIKYMLQNSFVKIGCQYIALQVRGLPQGAPPSPPLARLVCIRREYQWIKLLTSRDMICGMRFMDDLYMIFFYHTQILKTKDEARKMKNDFIQHCYYPQWKLKEIENYVFLSTECKWEKNKNKISVNWANKNKESVVRKKQKIIRFLHAKSFTANVIKTNSIYSQFLRVTRNSDNDNIPNDMKSLATEYQLLGYRNAFIKNQMKRVLEKISGNNK